MLGEFIYNDDRNNISKVLVRSFPFTKTEPSCCKKAIISKNYFIFEDEHCNQKNNSDLISLVKHSTGSTAIWNGWLLKVSAVRWSLPVSWLPYPLVLIVEVMVNLSLISIKFKSLDHNCSSCDSFNADGRPTENIFYRHLPQFLEDVPGPQCVKG